MYKTLGLLIMLFILVAALSACNSSRNGTDTSTQVPAEPVMLQISWVHEYSSSVFHVAERDGYFARNNLNINLVEGGFTDSGYIDPITEVLNADQAAFGLSDSASLIEARAKGQPVVAVLSVLQRGPNALISLDENNILTPQDIVGKRIMVSDGGARQNLNTFLTLQGIPTDAVSIVPRSDFGVDPLLNGDVDLLSGWTINEGVMVQEAGRTPNYIMLSDYGIDAYSFVLFTTEELIETNPEVVQRMVNAVLEALQAVVNDPAHATKQTLIYDSTLDYDAQLRRLEATIPLISVPGLNLGAMQPAVWAAVHQLLLDQGVLTQGVDLEAVYDLTFVNAFYSSAN